MNSNREEVRSLRDIEMEVLAEGREWMRQRLEKKLQEEANRHGGVFPPQRPQASTPTSAGDASADRGGGRGTKGLARKGSAR
jgi:hypothetical protein